MKRLSPTESFWTFATRLYDQPGISTQLLQWQDELGADVNMVLFACWHGATRGHFSDSLLQRAERFSRQWSEAITAPLRHARRWMKASGPDSNNADLQAQFFLLRDAIKQLELQGEQFQENMLESYVEEAAEPLPMAQQEQSIRHNLQAYAGIAGIDFAAMQEALPAVSSATVALISSDRPPHTAP